MDTQQTPPVQPQPTASVAAKKGILQQVEDFFDTYLHKKAPFHLPPNAKEWIVKYGPWITLVIMIIALPAILLAFGITAMFAPAYLAYGHGGMLTGLISLAVLILEAVALPGLFKRSLSAWQLVYYGSLLSAIGQIISLNFIGAIIGLVISMYFLFEIREYYK